MPVDELTPALEAAHVDADVIEVVLEQASDLFTIAADQKALLDRLKDLGVVKMGVRQKVVRVLREQRPHVPAPVAVPTPLPPAAPKAADLDSFWTGIMDANAEAMSAGELDAAEHAQPVRRELSHARAAPVPITVALSDTVNYPDTGPGVTAATGGAGTATAIVNDTLSAYRERGNAAFGRKDFATAERWYEKMLPTATDDCVGGMRSDHAATLSSLCMHSDGRHAQWAAALSNLAACALARESPDPVAAMRRLRPLLAALPRHVKGRLRAGRCCIMLGELQAAVGHFEVAYCVEKPATPVGGVQLRWAPPMADHERRRLVAPDGKTALSEAAQQAADGKLLANRLLSHLERARVLGAASRVDEALYLCRAVCRSCTHSTLGQRLMVSVLESSGRLWQAQQEAEMALAEHLPGTSAGADDEEELGVALARVLGKRGKFTDAEERLASLARSRQGESDGRAARALRGLRAGMQLKADGNAAYAAGDFIRAAAAYSRSIEADVEGCLRPHLLANRAQARMHEERFAEALADCDAALALDAHNVKLLLRRAACHVALHDPNRARYDYAAALKLEPTCQLASDFLRRHDTARRAKERAAQPTEGGYGYGPGYGPGGSAESNEPDEFDAYELLGVARDANAKVIKDAYRKLALKWHPDKHADADEAERARIEDEFRKVSLANLVLSDPVKRRQYDVGGRMKDITK